MSAEVESMFYTREKPWHGIGVEVLSAPNSKDAIQLAGLDWTVSPRKIYDANGNPIEGFVANTRDSDNSVLGIVSNKYKIVQNSEAFEFTDSLLDEGITYETAGSLHNGKTIWLLAKMPETKILDDKFDPYICFMNTHDGTGSIRVCMTPIRVVCNNTLNLALRNAKRAWSTCHMGDISSKLYEAKVTLGLANQYMSALDEEADKLANKKISDAQVEAMLNDIFPIDEEKDSERKINNIIAIKTDFFKYLAAADISQFRGTAWGAINAATDMVAHNKPGRVTKNYQENRFGKIVIGFPFVDELYKRLNVAV